MTAPDEAPTPSMAEATRVWATIGVLSFGGPAAQIALMHRMIVDEKRWMTERDFLGALSFCMLLPGPEAMQLATFAGWKLHGVKGGLIAGGLFVLPGAAVVLALAMIYAGFGTVPLVAALFLGVKAAVVVIVIEALIRLARRTLTGAGPWIVATLAFTAIFFFALPFPLIIAAAALWGALRERGPATVAPVQGPDLRATLVTAATWLGLWLVPLAALDLALPDGAILPQIGWFFSELAVVTFGGAYAVLAYMAQDVVAAKGWLTAGQMMDGLGLAETTPGPLILVTEFVGFLAAFRHGAGDDWGLGLLGAGVALWATFAPCFAWIFVGAPYVAQISSRPRLRGALGGIAAAVVGVIANLALWFALHVLFGSVDETRAGPLTLWVPDPATLQPEALGLGMLGAALLWWRRWPVPAVLGVAAAASACLAALT